MSLKILYPFLVVVILTLLMSSCSNPKKDYEPVEQLQKTTEQSIVSTTDDPTNIKSCQNVIDALQNFIKDHPEGEWNLTATAALASWQAKRDSMQEIVNAKLDFDKIQKLQQADEDVMQRSFDYAVRMKSCGDMIEELQQYLSKYPKSDWTTSAQTSLMSWKSREANLTQQFSSLFHKLDDLMVKRAKLEAQKQHRLSNIVDFKTESTNKNSVGGNIKVTTVYAVRMVGSIMHKSIFKLDITVSGGIVPESKQVFVDDNVKVVE